MTDLEQLSKVLDLEPDELLRRPGAQRVLAALREEAASGGPTPATDVVQALARARERA
jgi:hypothetical protein